MKEKIAKPLKLSDDWENNLYRNVVHVLAETEGMIPGGQAERVIQVVKALFKEEIEKLRNEPRWYHYVCWGSGTAKIKDEWGDKEYFYCPCFDGDFNCGNKNCKSAVIEGTKELNEIEQHENWMLDKVLKILN